MKYRGLRNWDNPKSLSGLIYFAQLIDELLFDYTLDTYKPSSMNTCTMCLEALSLIDDIENEVIDSANLKHVISEFIYNLKKDEIAKSLLNIKVKTISMTLENDDSPIQEKRTILEIIYQQIDKESYKNKTEELLLDAVNNEKEKNRIRSLTRSYITTLISSGYSSRYLSIASRNFFYRGYKTIKSPDDIKSFFKLTNGKKQEYVAIFKGNKLFEEVKISCKELDITIADELDKDDSHFAIDRNFSLDENEVYIIVDKFEAKDVFSARKLSEIQIELISTLTNLFHHKEYLRWANQTLLINKTSNTSRLVSSVINPMLLCSDLKAPNAAIKLNSFINNFSLNDSHSFKKFNRAAELHALALKNDSPENQLLNLWVALETLSPSNVSKHKAKINNITDSILPFLCLDYIYTLTKRLTMDLKNWNRVTFLKILNKIDGGDEREKLVKLLLLDEYSAMKLDLYKKLKDFHLLRNRIHYFSETLSSTKKIRCLLETHWERVTWQIRRIYRTRNQIVHAGHTPFYIDVLIKNTHDYLDVVVNSISLLASDGDKINTVEQAFKYSDIKYKEYMQELKLENKAIDSDNINRFVLNKLI